MKPSTPPPVPPRPEPLRRHWTETWWFAVVALAVPVGFLLWLGTVLP